MLTIHRVLIALFILTLSGCSTMEISSEHDPSARLSDLKTYAWLPAEKRDPALSRFDQEFVQERVQKAVDGQLAAKGYEKGVPDTADFLIRYYAALRTKMTFSQDDYGYSISQYDRHTRLAGSPRQVAHEFHVGSLVLDIVNAETKQLMWRGSAEAAVDPSWSAEKETTKINEAVRRMLQQFPPK